MLTVSKVNSSPSTYSSQLASGMPRIFWMVGVELGLGRHAVGVGAAGAGDGLQDEREANLLRGGARLVLSAARGASEARAARRRGPAPS